MAKNYIKKQTSRLLRREAKSPLLLCFQRGIKECNIEMLSGLQSFPSLWHWSQFFRSVNTIVCARRQEPLNFGLFLYFMEVGLFLPSSTHFLREELSVRRVLLAADTGLSRGAAFVVLTVPKPRSTWCVNQNWINAHTRKNAHICRQICTCALNHRRTLHKASRVSLFLQFYVRESRKRMRVARCIRHLFTQGCDGKALALALAFSQ